MEKTLFLTVLIISQPSIFHCWSWGSSESPTNPPPNPPEQPSTSSEVSFGLDVDCKSLSNNIDSIYKKYTDVVSTRVDGMDENLNKILDYVNQLHSGMHLKNNDETSTPEQKATEISKCPDPPSPAPCICDTIKEIKEKVVPLMGMLSDTVQDGKENFTANSTNTTAVEIQNDAPDTTNELKITDEHSSDKNEITESKILGKLLNREERDEEDKKETENLPCVPEKQKDDKNEVKKGGCVAKIIDNHHTIGMFYMSSYRHGHCSNRHPLPFPIRTCLGFCESSSYIDRSIGLWNQTIKCRSCQPLEKERVRIPLLCDDGFTFHKDFENIVSCECQPCRI